MFLRPVLLAAAFLGVAAAAPVPESKFTLPDGNWLLTSPVAAGDSAVCLLKAETRDGKLALAVIGSIPNVETTISEVKSDNGLSFKITTAQKFKQNGKERTFTSERVFVAAPGKNPKLILGSLGTDQSSVRAKLTATASEKLGPVVSSSPANEPLLQANSYQVRVSQLRFQSFQTKDPEKKKELQAKIGDAQKEADAKIPGLYREVVAKHAEAPAALDAGLALIGMSAKAAVKPEEAAALAKLVVKQAQPYGPRYAKPTVLRLAELLLRQKGLEAAALATIEPLATSLTEADAASFQFEALTAYKSALEATKKPVEAAALDKRLAELDLAMDAEYLKTVPPFKAAAFAGRTDKSANRVAVMELFTGAQCPPCVAADVAFDALSKTYQPADVILLQYHMHIPGPDPLTNPDTIGRWDYYEKLRGTPSTLFNGKDLAGGGGGMANAKSKYNDYREILDPLLEKKTDLKLSGKANRSGDKIAIAIDVAGLESTENLKLRLLVVEDTIKYVGGNKLRFHHHVVRAMPGGFAGVPIKDKSMRHTAEADVGAIRDSLVKYLDGFAKQRPFPSKVRPLDMKELKVIALVQNDETREILQAVQIDVAGKGTE